LFARADYDFPCPHLANGDGARLSASPSIRGDALDAAARPTNCQIKAGTMSEPVYRKISIASSADAEVDAINFCIEALKDLPDVNDRARVVEYLTDRFGARVELSK
jgi:hypothetical protein